MNHETIAKEHMDTNGHEGRIVFLEKAFGSLTEQIAELSTQVQVLISQMSTLSSRFDKLEMPGSGKMCDMHKESLTLFRAELALQKSELDSVKGRVLAWGGAIALAAVLLPFVVSHWGTNTRDQRMDKVEANQQSILKTLEGLKKP
jgi:hypothetical protein